MEQAYPLEWPEGWPRTPDAQRSDYSRFSTTFDKARRDLMTELDRLGAANVVVSTWLPLRRDGLPRADVARRRIEDPGVAIYFTYKGRRMAMARDAYSNIHDNLRSIGHAVAHLRGLERHGGGHMMERAFEGFSALPPPAVKGWWTVLGCDRDAPIDAVNAAWRRKVKETHPDGGGNAAAFQRVQDAYKAFLAQSEAA